MFGCFQRVIQSFTLGCPPSCLTGSVEEDKEKNDTATQTELAETLAEIGQRRADKALTPSHRVSSRRFETTVRKLLGRRVRLPLEHEARCT